MNNIFSRVLSVAMIITFGLLILMFLFRGASTSPLYLIMALFMIILGAALLKLYWPRIAGKKTASSDQPVFMVSRSVYVIMIITLVVSFLFEGYTYLPGWSSQHSMENALLTITFIGIIVALYLLTFFSKSIRGKYTFIELLTMKARDEREQHIINTVARSTYAFIRVLAIVVALLFFGLQLSGVSFSAFSIGYILLLFIFVAHGYFMILLRQKVE